MADQERGLGKCQKNHLSSYGYPSRPEEPHPFCGQCGNKMVWACPNCAAPMPEDVDELTAAAFCRLCGTGYFGADATGAEETAAKPA